MLDNINTRCPLPETASDRPLGLWSLWEMLDTWGYSYFLLGIGLGAVENDLRACIGERTFGIAGRLNLDAHHPAVQKLDAILIDIEKLGEDQILGAIPANASRLRAKIEVARRSSDDAVFGHELLQEVQRLKNDFQYVLHNRFFYSLAPDLTKFYGKPELLGPRVAKKFPKARYDIERAGNCLALGEPTACVLHLNRVMEIAIHRLARRLGVTPDAKDNMGSMLGKMTEPIKQLPDKTEIQKRKKEKWADCRTNLYHVKMAWRDPSSHGKQSYDMKEATDIFRRVQDFMEQLATL
ncbi:MAG: hypothetical protein P8Y71_04895 [Pseudolabrys sp.]